jgi:hypothetical protein
MSWSNWIEAALFPLLALGGARMGLSLARWSRTDDARAWWRALIAMGSRPQENPERFDNPRPHGS